jgi:hypothetical protein
MAAKQVWLGSDDEIKIIILDKRIVDDDNPKGTPIPFISNGVSKMKMFRLDNDAVLADSSIDNKISFNNVGEITIKLGGMVDDELSKFKSHSTYIKAYSPTHQNGQTIVHQKRPDSNLSITVN